MNMPFKYNPRSALGAAVQIQENIKRYIDAGKLAGNTKMKPVRDAAAMWNVDAATVSRAYAALVKDGYLIRQGSTRSTVFYVNPSIKSKDHEQLKKKLQRPIAALITQAKIYGIDAAELADMVMAMQPTTKKTNK
jgi:DNA-binding transcriptional regulator YhcF (GntR family)